MDLGRKALLYAKHGVPEYWVVDVEAAVIHQMSGPADGSYDARHSVPFGEPIGAATIKDLRLTLSV